VPTCLIADDTRSPSSSAKKGVGHIYSGTTALGGGAERRRKVSKGLEVRVRGPGSALLVPSGKEDECEEGFLGMVKRGTECPSEQFVSKEVVPGGDEDVKTRPDLCIPRSLSP